MVENIYLFGAFQFPVELVEELAIRESVPESLSLFADDSRREISRAGSNQVGDSPGVRRR